MNDDNNHNKIKTTQAMKPQRKTINQKNDDGEGYQAINDDDNKNKETRTTKARTTKARLKANDGTNNNHKTNNNDDK